MATHVKKEKAKPRERETSERTHGVVRRSKRSSDTTNQTVGNDCNTKLVNNLTILNTAPTTGKVL